MPVAPRAAALAALGQKHPNLDVVLIEDEDPAARRHEAFDLIVHLGKPVAEEDWFSQVLARLDMRLQASPSYLRRRGEPTSIAAVADRLLYFQLPEVSDPVLPVRRNRAVAVQPKVCSSNLSLLYELAESGAGVLFGPVLPAALGGASLRTVVDGVGATVTLRALSPRSSRVDPRVRAMLQSARSFVRAALL